MKPRKFEKKFQKIFNKLVDDDVDKALEIADRLIDEYYTLYERVMQLEDKIGTRLVDGEK